MLTIGRLPALAARARARNVSVFAAQVAEALKPRPGGLYLDATFGDGHHTESILAECPQATVMAADRDALSVNLASALAEEQENVLPLRARFSQLPSLLAEHGLHCLDGLTADLGVSEVQTRQKENHRGLDSTRDGRLDLRMEPESWTETASAANVLRHISDMQLEKIFK